MVERWDLLVSVGEGSYRRSDDVDFPSGKVLRIDPHATDLAPTDNPFNTADSSPIARQVYAGGFRNPFRIAVNPDNDQVAVGEVGTDIYEEINVIEAGGSYGFPEVEGPDPESAASSPSLWYKHTDGCNSIIGGAFVPASFVSANAGSWYTFSDLGCGGVWAASLDGSNATELIRISDKMDVSAANLIWGPDDSLYVVPIAPGPQRIQRLVHK